MKLHANAALSLTQRRRMVLRVLEQGWTIKAAAAAAETSPRTCGKWVSRYRSGRECALLDRSSAPHRVANRTCERRIEVIAALRRLRFTGPEIAELLAMPLSTVSGILTRIGMGRLGRLGLEPAERYERERPGELVHIDVKKLGRIVGGAGQSHHRSPGTRPLCRRVVYRRRRTPAQQDRLGVRPCRDRRRHPPGLRRSLARRAGRHRGWVPAPRAGLLRQLRHRRRARDHRQRLRLPVRDPRHRLPSTRDPAPAHPAATPTDQRQSRTLHPHHARRLGLRRDLRHQPRTHRSP